MCNSTALPIILSTNSVSSYPEKYTLWNSRYLEENKLKNELFILMKLKIWEMYIFKLMLVFWAPSAADQI